MRAVEMNQVGCMQVLGEAGAGVDKAYGNGWTPLMIAAHFGSTAAVEWLLARGADWRLTDQDGMTALDVAKAGGEAGGEAEAAAVLEAWIAEHA